MDVDSTLCAFSDTAVLLPRLTCSAAGVYEVTLTADDGTASGSDTGTVTVTVTDPLTPGGEGCPDLFAAQDLDVGEVCVAQDGDTLIVTFGTPLSSLRPTQTWSRPPTTERPHVRLRTPQVRRSS